MHPKAVELKRKYEDLALEMNELDPSSKEFVKVAKDRAELEPFVQKYNEIEKIENTLEENNEIFHQAKDEELRQLAKEENEELTAKKESLEEEILYMLLPKDKMKSKNIIVEIRAGTGGEEAALFAGDIFRMYTRYAEIKRWKLEIMDQNETELGGYKEIVFSISGKEVYGHMKYESGVHRVQRVPSTETGGRLHTSTASVVVYPEATDVDVQIDTSKDLRIDTFRASGAGGQHVNKTDSAVRITHIPTGIVVACQDERSQLQNRDTAMKILRSRLLDMELQKQSSETESLRRNIIRTGDRSEKIRTYNFPQNRITDHRINFSLYKLESVLSGECDELINACIMNEQEELLKSLDRS